MSDVQTKIGIRLATSGASGAREDIASIYRALQEGSITVKEANAALKEYGSTIRAQNRAVSLLRAEYRASHAAQMEMMRGMRGIASIGRTITSTYMTYTLMQTRVADKTRDVRDTQERLMDVQARRMQVVADLGANNAISMRLMGEEERLTKRLTAERRDLKRAQDQNALGYIGMGLEMFRIIPAISTTYKALTGMKTLVGGTWTYTGLTGLITKLGLVETAALAAATGITALAGGTAIAGVLSSLEQLIYKASEGQALTTMGGPGLLPEGAGLTMAEREAGMMPEDKYATWRAGAFDLFMSEKYPERYFEPWDIKETGEGFTTGGGGARDRAGAGGGETTVTTEGEDVDVEVKVVVTRYAPGVGDERRLR